MSNPQEFSELFEKLTWDEISPHVKRRVKEANYEIKQGDAASAAVSLNELQAFLERESLLGTNVRFDAAIPIITDEIITEHGIRHEPVIDPDVLDQEYFYGSFSGCSVVEFDNVPYPVLVYKLTQSIPNGFRTVQVPIDMARVEIQNEFAEAYDADDILIQGAFEVLETVSDAEYVATVKRIREVFENTDMPAVLRLRQLGEHAAELLAHPEHVKHLVRVQALETLIEQAVDPDLEYMVSGYSVKPQAVDITDTTPEVSLPSAPVRAIIDQVGMVDDFELLNAKVGDMQVKPKDGLQPAIQFLEERTREYQTIPLKYLATFEEFQYRESHKSPYVDSYSEAGLSPTCGEETRIFWERVRAGEITMGDSAIRRFVLGD